VIQVVGAQLLTFVADELLGGLEARDVEGLHHEDAVLAITGLSSTIYGVFIYMRTIGAFTVGERSSWCIFLIIFHQFKSGLSAGLFKDVLLMVGLASMVFLLCR
jgi:hypothetical protein